MEREIEGREFDWFALDKDGRIAVFCTSGKGTIPESVKLNYSEHDDISDNLETPHFGSTKVFEDLARYGLSVFDWKRNDGPYLLKSSPKAEIAEELKSRILAIKNIPVFAFGFKTAIEVIF